MLKEGCVEEAVCNAGLGGAGLNAGLEGAGFNASNAFKEEC